jgi:hypothetical protein
LAAQQTHGVLHEYIAVSTRSIQRVVAIDE